ncbi:MAG: glutathione S-transferase family protein [Cognatishimia sp.]
MPIRPTDNPDILAMKGLNVFHFSTSNCSMRIRLFLEEKGIEWNDCAVDLRAQENLTEEYFAIHPQGLVPAIVHDGVIVHESADILEYLEETFPEPSLIPDTEQGRADLEKILEFTRSGHMPIIKTWVYGRNNRPTKTPESMAKLEALQKDKSLVDFHKETLSEGGIPEAKILEAEKTLKDMFQDLDDRLSQHEWILGDKMTLADIAWIPQYALFQRNKFPFGPYPHFRAYVERWQKRESYVTAVGDHMPGSMTPPE